MESILHSNTGAVAATVVLSLFVVGKLVLFEGAGRVCVSIVSFGTRSSACLLWLARGSIIPRKRVYDTWYQVPRFMILEYSYGTVNQYEKS